jgi:hypothetical protein
VSRKKRSSRQKKRNQVRAKKAFWMYRVEKFMLRDMISKQIPGSTILDKRLINTNRNKKQKQGLPVTKRVLRYRICDLYKDFKSEYTTFPYSEKYFSKMRPFYIMTSKTGTKKRKCICTKCSNVIRKLQTLNRFCRSNSLSDLCIDTPKDLIKLSLCSYEESDGPNLECLNRTCVHCGSAQLLQYYSQIVGNTILRNTVVQWTSWKDVKRSKFVKRTQQEEVKTYNEIVNEVGTFDVLVDFLMAELEPYALHDFRMRWQWHQLQAVTKNLPDNHALMIMDYSENISLQFLEETIASHAKAFTLSLFPVALYYHAAEDNGIVLESINLISDDLQHDSHAVRKFTDVIMNHLKQHSKTEIQVVHRFSDGCASQFRSRHTMTDMSAFSVDYPNCIIVANYGETAEFKNMCEGFGDHVKTPLRNAIIRGDLVLDSTKTVFEYLQRTQSFEPADRCKRVEHRRKFFYIEKPEINRNEDRLGMATPGLLAIRSVYGMEPGFIGLRKLSCYCSACLQLDYKSCTNTKYVEQWKTVHVRTKR